jgi:hypothetical protein
MKWNPNNKKYFTNLGYVFTKMKDEFDVKINDLTKSSDVIIKVKCDYCGKEKETNYREYIRNCKKYNKYACSIKCSFDKKDQTCLEIYGTTIPMLTEQVKAKYKKTCLEIYGFENPLQNKEIQEKSRITCKINNGVDYPMQSNEIMTKSRITCKINNGVDYPMQNSKIVEKSIQSTIDHYGEIWTNQVPKYNPNSIIYLDMISEKIGLNIQHALNGKEKKFQRYWIDGYIEQYNICLEWDETAHNRSKQRIKDIKKDNFLI